MLHCAHLLNNVLLTTVTEMVLVHTVKLKPIIKDQIPRKLVTSGISDVATASVHSEKTWAKSGI